MGDKKLFSVESRGRKFGRSRVEIKKRSMMLGSPLRQSGLQEESCTNVEITKNDDGFKERRRMCSILEIQMVKEYRTDIMEQINFVVD